MAKFTSSQFLTINAATLAFVLLVSLTCQLSPLMFAIGLLVMLVNAYLIVTLLIDSQRKHRSHHYSFLPPEGQRYEEERWTS